MCGGGFFVTVHAYVPSNRICRGFAFKYGKFLLPPRYLTALSVPKVPTYSNDFFCSLGGKTIFGLPELIFMDIIGEEAVLG